MVIFRLCRRLTVIPYVNSCNRIYKICFRLLSEYYAFLNVGEFRRIERRSVMASKSILKNRLGDEKSPYLLQHASNPVDWYPWCQDAFDKAKQENKLIFLSVGYSTCHWCHVMERESFENPEIGKLMSDNFVCIKVDREERPDVDRVYMTFIQATTGHGGWPMSVWLTPDLKPIIGGTYFPPNDRYFGQPGFRTILTRIIEQWKDKKDKLEKQGTAITNALIRGTKVSAPEESDEERPGEETVQKCLGMLEQAYDSTLGGFGSEPKFPQPVNFNFLFHNFSRDSDSPKGKASLDMCLHTLSMMAKGGIHDHVGQGFHRYSTDKYWHVPHFEKMLYDQAQLVVAYCTAYQTSKIEVFAEVARDILKYVSRDLSHPAGGFYSAQDADSCPTIDSSVKKEGAFCVWTEQEIKDLLPDIVSGSNAKEADVFIYHFSVSKDGNVDPYQDPHDELKGKNVLIIRGSVEETAAFFHLDAEKTKHVLQKGKETLWKARQKRPQPHLDDKMLSSWNGLMMSGFACAGQTLGDVHYINRATQCAEFIYDNLYNQETGMLLRSCYNDNGHVGQTSAPINGFVDDYAFLIRGLLDLYEASFSQRWLEWAEQLQQKQDELFWDVEAYGYFNNPPDPAILFRLKDDQDGAEPCANSVSISNLVRLSVFLDENQYVDTAEKLIRTFAERIMKIPMVMPQMVCGIMLLVDSCKQVIIVGEKNDEETQQLIQATNSMFLPNKVLIQYDEDKSCFLARRLKVLTSLTKIHGKATAYVCQHNTCSLPVTNPQALKDLLKD